MKHTPHLDGTTEPGTPPASTAGVTAHTARIAVTGAAGFLGSRLVRRLLATGHEVNALDIRPAAPDIRPAGNAPAGLRSFTGDIRDPHILTPFMADMDAVVHCATALPTYPGPQIRSIVVDGTRAVLEAARTAGVPRVVHLSSTAVYGLPKKVPTPEDYPRVPADAYSGAKLAAERIAERYRAQGMCLPVLRPKTVVGPGRLGLFAMLFEWADEGRNFPLLGGGDIRNQMLALDDLVDAVSMVLAAAPEAANDTYNIGAQQFGTLREDFQSVLDAAGHGKRIVSLPARPTVAALRLLDRAHLSPVYRRLLFKLLSDSYADVSKAHDQLGFRPKWSNQEAILHSYTWWREQGRHHGPRPGGAGGGRTSNDVWKQGALALAKRFF
ncbi:NAD-dependent epimerase/dehydratase family protein [Streptomyces monticola]|uniref:NAD-dependent epimerase/dehydratase family protein n=1 Tax=Streptomyces monticola TaxID=2666263 RepID=A0ABW2JRB0_9ACTN